MNTNTNTIIWAQLFEYSNNPNIHGNTGLDHKEQNCLVPPKFIAQLCLWFSGHTLMCNWQYIKCLLIKLAGKAGDNVMLLVVSLVP